MSEEPVVSPQVYKTYHIPETSNVSRWCVGQVSALMKDLLWRDGIK